MEPESTTRPPVQRTTYYETRVGTITEAFAFVMEHLDRLGPMPSVQISPGMVVHAPGCGCGDDEDESWFDVTVSGTVEEVSSGD